MIRSIDWRCDCGEEILNVMAEVEEVRACNRCGGTMEQIWWKRGRTRKPAQWDDSTAVMVHRNAKTGEIRYPGRHDAQLKQGFERVYLRSLREVEKFEQGNGVRNEAMWYDRNGRGFDDFQHGRKVT